MKLAQCMIAIIGATAIHMATLPAVAQAQRPINCVVVELCVDPDDAVEVRESQAACRVIARGAEGFRMGVLMDPDTFSSAGIPTSLECPPPSKGEDCGEADEEFVCVGIAG